MHRFIMSLAVATLVAAPTAVSARDYQSAEIHPGAFGGVRIQLSLGGQSPVRPRAALTIAPTQTQISYVGTARTKIGEGIALSFTPGAKPKLMLAGVPAASALHLQRDDPIDPNEKLGVSKSGWVAIGVGVVAVAAAVGFVLLVDAAKDNTE